MDVVLNGLVASVSVVVEVAAALAAALNSCSMASCCCDKVN